MYYLPEKLYLSIGGFMGSCYSVELAKGTVRYRWRTLRGGFPVCSEELQIHIDEAQWRDFRTAVDDIGIWGWQAEYPNPGVCDGTQWKVDLAYLDKRVCSCGDNAYPQDKGLACWPGNPSAVFTRFTEAVSVLVGGREFQ